MKSNLALAIEFANSIKKTKHILQIVLFGSVARGEDTEKSDIDIAIIHDSRDKFEFMKKINKEKPDKIQTTFVHINELPDEMEIAGALSGEGLLLYGNPILIKEGKSDLKPKILISYLMAGLPQTEKMKINRALYGSISKSVFKDKEYGTETFGLVGEPGIEKISKGVLLAERRSATKLSGLLRRFNVKFKEIPVWTY